MPLIKYALCAMLVLSAATAHAQGTFTAVDSESVPGPGDNMVVVERGPNRFTLTVSFQANAVWTHRIEPSGSLTPVSSTATGSGPRAIAMARNGDYAIIVNSNDDDMSVMAIGSHGELTEVGRYSSGGDNPFDVEVAYDDLVVIANRDSDSIALFGINRRGQMQQIGSSHSAGVDPHVVAIGPQGTVAVANSTSNDLTIFDLDRNGNMSLVDEAFQVGNSPKAVAFGTFGFSMFVATRSPAGQEDQIQAYEIHRPFPFLRANWEIEPAGSTPGGAFLTDLEVTPDRLFTASVHPLTGRDQVCAFRRWVTALAPDTCVETGGSQPSFKTLSSLLRRRGNRLVVVAEFQNSAVRSFIYDR